MRRFAKILSWKCVTYLKYGEEIGKGWRVLSMKICPYLSLGADFRKDWSYFTNSEPYILVSLFVIQETKIFRFRFYHRYDHSRGAKITIQ